MAADALAAGLQEPVIIPTSQASRFVNTSAAGVNRIVPLGDCLVVNNIGRNWEVWQLADSPEGPVVTAAALYDRTLFPGQDNPSIFDIDIHAALPSRDGRSLLIPNHYGRVRCFPLPLPMPGDLPEPLCQLQLLGDTERILLAQDCLIASSTRGEQTTDPPQPGIFISEPVTSFLNNPPSPKPKRLAYRHELAGWGVVSALGLNQDQARLAVADADHAGVFELDISADGLRLGRCLWQAAVPYLSQWVEFAPDSDRLLIAGYDRDSADPYGTAWDACKGGGVSAFSSAGDLLFQAALPPLTAWGYGSEAVALSPAGRLLYALDRTAGLHRLDLATGQIDQLSAGLGASEGASLGIGHCAISHGHLYAGFSRGGYRLLRYKLV